MSFNSTLETQITSHLEDIATAVWDELSAGCPFQSLDWYAFGEKVMSDCQPYYIIVSSDGKPVARAACFRVGNEPLPVTPLGRTLLGPLLRKWPLFVCRSPLSSTTGLILPPPPLRDAAFASILAESERVARQEKCSFMLYSYLEAGLKTSAWPPGSIQMEMEHPGTTLQLKWDSFDAYLASGNKKDRQHYKRACREAEKLGIRVERHRSVPDVDSALALIRSEEKKFGSAPDPWIRRLLDNIQQVGGTYLEARIGERLVGCGTLLYDGNAQMTVGLGLAQDVPYVYFQLLYAGLQEAFDRGVRLLRWGSGAYDVKQQLGFGLENNGFLVFRGLTPFSALVSRFALSQTE